MAGQPPKWAKGCPGTIECGTMPRHLETGTDAIDHTQPRSQGLSQLHPKSQPKPWSECTPMALGCGCLLRSHDKCTPSSSPRTPQPLLIRSNLPPSLWSSSITCYARTWSNAPPQPWGCGTPSKLMWQSHSIVHSSNATSCSDRVWSHLTRSNGPHPVASKGVAKIIVRNKCQEGQDCKGKDITNDHQGKALREGCRERKGRLSECFLKR